MDNKYNETQSTMALGQKRKVQHGALKYERETEYKVQEITISAKEHTSKNNLTPPQRRNMSSWHATEPRRSGMLMLASRNHATLAHHSILSKPGGIWHQNASKNSH